MTTTIGTTGFKNSVVDQELTVLIGQSESEGFSCVKLLNEEDHVSGAFSPRMIVFNAGWTTCNVTFQVFKDETYTNGATLNIGDGVDKAPYILPNCAAGEAVPLIPFLFDSVTHFKVVCSTPQAAESTADIRLQPLYQVQN